ncbi:MAG TPA: dihydropteroate synthase [Thermoleophilaceae bacterium]|nr:dihydropteroate synthase [Thermoleophilaceae bacterium]
MRLVLRGRTFEASPETPLVMGIVNANDDSFSGSDPSGSDPSGSPAPRSDPSGSDPVALAREQVAAGAAIIDVGGESGRTDRAPRPAAEEAALVVPVVERLTAEGVAVSVDTWKPEVARAALAAGAVMVNDVSGLADTALADACADAGAGLVLMHTRAAPKVKDFPGYEDVAEDVVGFLRERMAAARERGVADDAIVLDPGPDFAKTPAETVETLRALSRVAEIGRPVLLAASRKDFVGAITGRSPRDRLAGTLAALGEGLDGGASILRVHDVAAAADFLSVRATLRGDAPPPGALRADLRREPAA